jgi:hypothetical protein
MTKGVPPHGGKNDEVVVGARAGNEVKKYFECAATPRFLRYGRNDKVGWGVI